MKVANHEQLSFRISPELRAELEAHAAEHERSLASTVRWLLRVGLLKEARQIDGH